MKIVFEGDSITDAGRDRSNPHDMGEGYPKFASAMLQDSFPDTDFEFINMGISGDRTEQLVERVDQLVAHQPDVVVILIGVNDVWAFYTHGIITTDAAFKDWSEQLDKNLYVGAFEQATSEDHTWILLLILAILLLLILVIVLLYVLYIKGILKPCGFLKAIASIVSVFFALCLSLAAAWLWILKLFGFNEERLLKKYPLAKKKKKNRATLEDSLEALKDSDPNFDKTAHTVSQEQIAQKTLSVETEMYSFEEETEGTAEEADEAVAEGSEDETAE